MTAEPQKTRKTKSRTDADGVKVVEVAGIRKGVWLLGLALLLAAGAGVLALRLALREEAPEPEVARVEPAVAAAPSAPPAPKPTAALQARPVRRQAAPPPPPPPADREVPPEVAPLPEFPEEPGNVASGIAVFPPLGTDPLKVGLLVPEDFELPEGYVRHYQATDDGESLPAILMFHPDFEWLDANGRPIPLPENLIVPPELAPPGMPQVPIELPVSQGESDLP